jgi:hypothetical protein
VSENSIGRTNPNHLCSGIGKAVFPAICGRVPNLGPNFGPLTPNPGLNSKAQLDQKCVRFAQQGLVPLDDDVRGLGGDCSVT